MLELYDYIGLSGAFFLISAYFITTYKLSKNIILIDIFNLYGSGAVGYNCFLKNTYSGLIVEFVWFIIALISLLKNVIMYISDSYKDVEKTHILTNNINNYQTL